MRRLAEVTKNIQHGDTEPRSTEGLWPAGLRPAGRTRPMVEIQTPQGHAGACISAIDLVRAARSAAPQAFSHAAFKFFSKFFSVRPPCLRASVLNSSPCPPYPPSTHHRNRPFILPAQGEQMRPMHSESHRGGRNDPQGK